MAEDVVEIYSGFGMVSDDSDLEVSRLITEEDIVDSLFFICDADKTGSIPVSRIIDFLKFSANVAEAGQSDQLDQLATLLDPEHKDVLVNLETCRKQISEWIEKIKPQSELADRENKLKCSRNHIDESRDGRRKHDTAEIQRLSEQEIADLNIKIDNLHHQNKKLTEDNGKLKTHLEVLEETASYQSLKLEKITKRMKSLQQVVERREETLSENVDLKATVTVLEEEKLDLSDQLKQMEKANMGLENHVRDLERKLEKAKYDVQIAEKQQIDLQTTLFKQKHLWTRSEEEKDVIEAHLSEKSEKFEELQAKFDNMKKITNELKDQKVELELQLSETQQQLFSVQMKAEKFGVPDTSNSSEDETEPVYIVPSAASTPKGKKGPVKSLGMELRRMLDDDKHLPSPLCEREWDDDKHLPSPLCEREWDDDKHLPSPLCEREWDDDKHLPSPLCEREWDDDKHLPSPLCEREWDDSLIMKSAERENINNKKTDFSNDLARILDSTTSNDDINGVSSSVTSEIMQRQEMVIRRMSELVDAGDKQDREQLCSSPTTFKVKLKEDFEFFTKKITLLSSAKCSAEDRASRMMTTMQRLKDENARLRQIHEDSLQQMLDCSSGFQASLDGRLLMIKEQLNEKKLIIRSMEQKLSSMNIELKGVVTENSQLKTQGEELQSNKKNLEMETKRLKQNNLEVVEKFHKSELRSLELKEEMQNSLDFLNREKQRCKYLEDDLVESKRHHRVDLEEIWRVVQKEVERDHKAEQESLRSDALKDHVAKEIETLKSQLYKTQAAFTALKTKTKQLRVPEGKCELRIAHDNEDQGPSSPLVDALTIEFFDGSQLSRRNSRKSHTFATVEEALYAQSNLGIPVCSRDLAVSCPSLASQGELVTSGTQTEDVGGASSSRDTNLDTSNSSSTSGVLDLDLSSSSLRSLDCRNRRKIFLRNFQRFDSDSQTSQSIESNTDTDVSVPRQRSPSFLAAIEGHGQRVGSANVTSDMIVKQRICSQSFIPVSEMTQNGSVFKRSRSSSFQKAIESGQRTPTEAPSETDFISTSPDTTPENLNFPDYVLKQWGDANAQRPNDQRMVSFKPSSYTSSDQNAQQSVDYWTDLNSNPSHVYPYANSVYKPRGSGIQENCSGYYNNVRSNSDVGYTANCTNVPLQPTDDQRPSSPKQTTRKLSTLVEEDLGEIEKDRSPGPGPDATTTRLESSFHDNDKVVTTFKVSADLHHHLPPTPHSPATRPRSPPRYASVLAARATDNNAANSRCSPDNVNSSPRDNIVLIRPSSRKPYCVIPLAASFTVPAYTNSQESSSATHVGTKSPLLSEKSSLIAKANKDKSQTSPTRTSHGVHIISSSKTDVDRMTSTDTQPISSQKKSGTRKNLARLILEHDAAKTTTLSSSSSVGKSNSDDPAKMDQLTDHSNEGCLELSPRSKNPPLTRNQSIHGEDEQEGKVSFRRSPENGRVKSESVGSIEETLVDNVWTTSPAAGLVDEDRSEERQSVLSRLSKVSSPTALSKIREPKDERRKEHLARKREQGKHMKMPELSELSEFTGTSHNAHSSTSQSPPYSGMPSSTSALGSESGDPPGPTKNPAYPSLPDEFLKSLGLLKENSSESPEELTDQGIEAKFASLALAFKTDKLTLEKRLEIQKRSRDVSEQNIEKELHGIKDSVATLSQLCIDAQMRDVLTKLQHHLEVLEQSVVRVSSRAEVYGAVQQESRMSRAIEVMIQHVENLKLVHAKEHTELEEARKFLQDHKVYNSLQGSDSSHFDAMSLSKRSLSLAGNATVKLHPRTKATSSVAIAASAASRLLEGARRRNSVSVLPKMLGGSGTPFSLSQSSSSLESLSSVDQISPIRQLSISLDEDPKSRFQSAVASTTVKAAVTGVLRRASLDRSFSNSSNNLPKQSVIKENSADKSLNSQKPEAKDDKDKSKKEEEAFQRGFEQGVRAHLGREMSELREQQQAFCDTLENLMDENELSPEEANCDRETVMTRLWQLRPQWEKSGKKIRLTLAGFICLMALCSIVFTLFPFGAATVTGSLRHSGNPPV